MVKKSANKELSFMKLNNNKLTHKKILLLLLAFGIFLLPARLVFAQNSATDSSNSATQKEQENENSTINNIKKVIQEKKTELGTVGANLRSERAYLAKVLRVSEETLTVSNYSGSKIIPLEEDILIQKKDKDIKVEELAVDNWVGVYGEMNNDNLKIKKIVVYDHDFSPKNKIITLGSIASIGKNDLSLNPRSGEEKLNFSFDKYTSFQDNQGEEIDSNDFYEDLQCIIVAFEDKNGNYVISTIKALSAFK